ncbi:MAG TPA: hypothetical protein VFT22_33600 [Kofleriaceae bacterium]|nr:hypothetical protein [Kofleriaceae bacterium]
MMRAWQWWMCGLLASAACGYPSLPPIVDHAGDAGSNVPDAGVGDAGAGEEVAQFAFTPAHLQAAQLPATVHDVTITGDTTINTSALLIGGRGDLHFVQQGAYAVLYAGAFTLNAHVTITGSLPLIIVATKTLRVSGNMDLGAVGPLSGPGAVSTGNGGDGIAARPDISGLFDLSGGGGGGHGAVGATGGTADVNVSAPGSAGGAYSNAQLVGGSSGGSGGRVVGGDHAAPGGGGGGALELSSQMEIFVGDVAINAGGGGGGGGVGNAAGGGGGAGGEIMLEAPTMAIEGFVAANGGGGGGGSSANGTTPGTAGSDGTASLDLTAGGMLGDPDGGYGGPGAGGNAEPDAGGSARHAGGGGGSAGVIELRYRAATPPMLTGAHFTPAAKIDTTLP